jgi:hypothetical protein
MLPVQSTEDIEYLVKESEIVTGRHGRKFVIYGADHIAYLIQWRSIGCMVQRLDDADNPVDTRYLLPCELRVHSLGEALRAGLLFTPPVRQ